MENIKSVLIEITLVDENGTERTVSSKQRTTQVDARDNSQGPLVTPLLEQMTIAAFNAAKEAAGLE